MALLAAVADAKPVSVGPHPAFPARRDVDSPSQFRTFEQPELERIQPYLRSLPWLYDAGWIEARQDELFLHLFAKLKHETPPPFTGDQNLLEWRTIRHRKAYTTKLVEERLQVSDPNAAWEMIAQDLKVCAPLLNSDSEAPEARRKEAFAVVASDVPLMGAVLGDAHAARLAYEGFLLPFLELANPTPGLWPSQSQTLLDNYQWLLQDENLARVGDVSRMMIRYGDEWYDAHYDQQMADVIRYAYGNYLKSQGQPLRAMDYWRAIKAPNLSAGADFLIQQTEKEEDGLAPSQP